VNWSYTILTASSSIVVTAGIAARRFAHKSGSGTASQPSVLATSVHAVTKASSVVLIHRFIGWIAKRRPELADVLNEIRSQFLSRLGLRPEQGRPDDDGDEGP